MNGSELQDLLKDGEELFAALEQETSVCLKNLETLTSVEIERFVARRQGIIAAIRNFDAEFSRCREWAERTAEPGALASLERFKQWLGEVRQRVIDTDGLLLTLARKELRVLQNKLTVISTGRRALYSYRDRGRMEC